MPRGKDRRASPSRSPSETKKLTKREKQDKRQDKKLAAERTAEQQRQRRTDEGKKGAMRAFSDPREPSDSCSDTSMSESRARELGAAAPAARDDKRYLEREKEQREKAKSKAKEEKRKRVEEQEQDALRPDDIDIREMLSGMTADDFHKVLLIQDREIRQLKQDREETRKTHRMQAETNTVFSKVITAQVSANKKNEEAVALYCYELTGLPRDDSQESKR